MKVLNVGGNNKDIGLPEIYNAWDQILLDIDPSGKPDICCDAREMMQLESSVYDAIYCSHNLEHYFEHDAEYVLEGFLHVLKPQGFAHKNGFTTKSLKQILLKAGFSQVALKEENLEISAIAFKANPTSKQLEAFGIT